jgi:hypothetical protein
VGIRDLIETDEERAFGRRELERVGIAEGLAPRDHALMVASSGRLRQHAFGLDLGTRTGLDPRDLRSRTLRHPHLERLTRPTVDLAYGAPPVDEFARHRRGTSR